MIFPNENSNDNKKSCLGYETASFPLLIMNSLITLGSIGNIGIAYLGNGAYMAQSSLNRIAFVCISCLKGSGAVQVAGLGNFGSVEIPGYHNPVAGIP